MNQAHRSNRLVILIVQPGRSSQLFKLASQANCSAQLYSQNQELQLSNTQHQDHYQSNIFEFKQRGLCGVSCVSARACNPAPKVPLSKTFWLTFKFVPVIQKFSRASQVITCVIQSPTAKPLQSSQACHIISLSLSDDSAEPEVFLANKLVMSIVQKPIDNVQADRSSQLCTQSYS